MTRYPLTFTPELAKSLRLQLGLTQQEMALLAGYSPNSGRQQWYALEQQGKVMHSTQWELLLLRTDVHPTYYLTLRV